MKALKDLINEATYDSIILQDFRKEMLSDKVLMSKLNDLGIDDIRLSYSKDALILDGSSKLVRRSYYWSEDLPKEFIDMFLKYKNIVKKKNSEAILWMRAGRDTSNTILIGIDEE